MIHKGTARRHEKLFFFLINCLLTIISTKIKRVNNFFKREFQKIRNERGNHELLLKTDDSVHNS